MKRKKYTYYLNAEEYERIKKYALKNGRPISAFVRQFALAEVGRHEKEKSVYKRLEALEYAIRKMCI